jgi:hypothetical protein
MFLNRFLISACILFSLSACVGSYKVFDKELKSKRLKLDTSSVVVLVGYYNCINCVKDIIEHTPNDVELEFVFLIRKSQRNANQTIREYELVDESDIGINFQYSKYADGASFRWNNRIFRKYAKTPVSPLILIKESKGIKVLTYIEYKSLYFE